MFISPFLGLLNSTGKSIEELPNIAWIKITTFFKQRVSIIL